MDTFDRFGDLEIFSKEGLGNVKTLKDEFGKPWFVAKDVAEALGLSSGATDAYARLEDSEKAYVSPKSLIVDSNDNQNKGRGGSRRPVLIISESGMYDMILSSRKESARTFQRWITREVLPSIRENGGYIYDQENLKEDERFIIKEIVNDLSERVDMLTDKNTNLKENNDYLKLRRKQLRKDVSKLKEIKRELKGEVKYLKHEVFLRNEALSDYEDIIVRQTRDYAKLLQENKEIKGEVPSIDINKENKKEEVFYIDPASGLRFSSREIIIENEGIINNVSKSEDNLDLEDEDEYEY